MKKIDLTGNQYGELKVVKYSGKSKSGIPLWECICSCGNSKIVAGSDLKRGHTKNCGCLRNAKNLAGQKYGLLTVVCRKGSSENRNATWLCICDCGKEKIVTSNALKFGYVKSCGCLNREISTIHGKSNTRLYSIYNGMKHRCYNTQSESYRYYGARGITICDEWRNDFMNFYDWAINNGYSDDLSIDRIDVDGNYCPKNCRWVDFVTQANNKRNSRKQMIL